MPAFDLSPAAVLADRCGGATLADACICQRRRAGHHRHPQREAIDVTRQFATMRDLCEMPDPAVALAAAHGPSLVRSGAARQHAGGSARSDPSLLLAPVDLQR